MTTEETPRRMEVSELVFDIKNPRLSEYDLETRTETPCCEGVMWQ